ncbi:transcription termination/antitermination protein NusG [Alphaproteobacteria bacterium endosymbiont of Tiliacea citrago]|uniref:transcription termination/antitermination protein NusG n=1 Tax=Alphaproteobacteria bacterium endosymbiont of Tiliacea citrago TaxID=3077944 RepID=UPI00313BAA5C
MSDQSAKWYIVKCPTGVETKFEIEFKENLGKYKSLDLLSDMFIPALTQQKTTSRRAIMANYIFVKMILNETIDKIFDKIKYASLMRDQHLKIVEVDEETVNNLKIKDAEEKEKLESKLEVGEIVKILEAPFMDFEGKIEKIEEASEMVSVSVNILGNPIFIELPFSAIKRINNE